MGYGAWGDCACVPSPERAISPPPSPLGSRCSPRGEALSLRERKGREVAPSPPLPQSNRSVPPFHEILVPARQTGRIMHASSLKRGAPPEAFARRSGERRLPAGNASPSSGRPGEARRHYDRPPAAVPRRGGVRGLSGGNAVKQPSRGRETAAAGAFVSAHYRTTRPAFRKRPPPLGNEG